MLHLIFSSPVGKYRKSYCTTPGVGVGVDVGIGIGVGVNKNGKSFMPKLLKPHIF